MRHDGPPKVSIVTVTRNAQAVLEGTIRSVLAQRGVAIEYLIIDGASSDASLDIVERYRDRVDVVLSEPDTGIFAAMNKSLPLLSGEWVNFMNAGDSFVDEDVVASVMAEAGDADLVGGDSYMVDARRGTRSYEKARGLKDIWRSFIPCVHQALFTRTAWMQQAGFDSRYRYAADYDFVLRSHVAGKRMRFLDRPICNFLLGGASRQHEMQMQVESLMSALSHGPAPRILDRDNVFLRGLVDNVRSLPGGDAQPFGRAFNRELQAFFDTAQRLVGGSRRIALYGAGSVGQALYRLLGDRICCVVDKSPKASVDSAVPVIPPAALAGRDDYEIVLISVLGREAQIIAELEALGIDPARIRSFADAPGSV